MSGVDLGIIFNLFKIKYVKLDELIMKYCKEINPKSRVNFFINFESVLKKLSASNIDEYLKVRNSEKIYEMIAEIINLISHYRMYFTKNKLYSKIYVYMGYPFNTNYLNQEIIPDYRSEYKHKYTKDRKNFHLSKTIEYAIDHVKTILEYVEGVYFITSDTVEPSVVPKLIIEENKSDSLNFILTTDRYEYQYVNKLCYILRPKQNDSYLLSKENAIRMIKLEEKLLNEIEVGSNFLPFILSLTGDKYRNIGKLKGVGVGGILKILNKAIEENLISKDVTNINLLEKIVRSDYIPILRTNYLCTDVDAQYMRLNIRVKHNILSQIKDKFDNVSLKRLNDQFFRLYPIHLIELTEANKLLKGPKKDIFLQ
jgi:hypothetical protein